ncbi:hypothetical protein HFO42_22865 [Rhizobium leguminosarum]|uniref:Uncharacterized protein n=1 Tax=Rhizobium leguminosarum TaxID=384 RepID=A0AAJ1ABU9_RHILE|nr:hypothetical protein [Rhizobium leguminosarum]MBY5533805.1 hypothetical protein [Rhizobium leguminosarum]MBY5594893.1 hypothetical protein [Rhizobium leguminosarum]MBY5630918.1 hypothetical protein [Rhizobium leguminosarum]MBY5652651.1 hypothetical protein [Rhizobium leguminosarum]
MRRDMKEGGTAFQRFQEKFSRRRLIAQSYDRIGPQPVNGMVDFQIDTRQRL